MKKIILLTFVTPLFCFMSCSESEPLLQTTEIAEEIQINGNCDVYSLNNSENASWTVVDAPEWITPVKYSGGVQDTIKVYVESNSFANRDGVVSIEYSNGETISTRVTQTTEQSETSLQKAYAVGWSFDVRTYMDSRGLREQVFNSQKINEYDDEMYTITTNTMSRTQYFFGESAQELSDDMSGKLNLNGKFDSFSLNLQGSFGKSAINNSKRIFSWIRAIYPEKIVYLFQFDPSDAQKYDLYTTDFKKMRNEVINSNGSDETITKLIERYGTHYVQLSYLGGSLDYYYSSVTENIDENLDVKAAINFGFQEKFGLKGDVKYKDSFSSLSNEIIEKFSVLGGNSLELTNAIASGTADTLIINVWSKSFKSVDKMELLDFQLSPLSNLFPADIKAKIDNYTNRMYYKDIPVTRSTFK